MRNKLKQLTNEVEIPVHKPIQIPGGPLILFGYITEPPGGGGGGGGGGWDPDYPTYPGTGGGGGGGGESTSDGMGGTLPSGNLSSDGQEQVEGAFFAPAITSFVRFTYTAVTATPGWIVMTRSLGNYKSASGTGFMAIQRTLDVDLYASNITVHVYFQTTDTNGGLCHWQAMHR